MWGVIILWWKCIRTCTLRFHSRPCEICNYVCTYENWIEIKLRVRCTRCFDRDEHFIFVIVVEKSLYRSANRYVSVASCEVYKMMWKYAISVGGPSAKLQRPPVKLVGTLRKFGGAPREVCGTPAKLAVTSREVYEDPMKFMRTPPSWRRPVKLVMTLRQVDGDSPRDWWEDNSWYQIFGTMDTCLNMTHAKNEPIRCHRQSNAT